MAGGERNLLPTVALKPVPAFKSPPGISRFSRGFTLTELLVVLGIMAILAVATLPAIKGTLSSVDLKGAAASLAAEVDLARQTATTRNMEVDMRFYPDSDTSVANAYNIVALVITPTSQGNTSAAELFVSPPLVLTGDAILDSSNNFSTLLVTGTTGNPQGTESTKAPPLIQGKSYVYFSFLPNGTLNLAAPASGAPWSLTLRGAHAKTLVNGGPAADFVTLLLDPATSRARVYQP
jgi:uncharacterized protein (TIGR02596 family)